MSKLFTLAHPITFVPPAITKTGIVAPWNTLGLGVGTPVESPLEIEGALVGAVEDVGTAVELLPGTDVGTAVELLSGTT